MTVTTGVILTGLDILRRIKSKILTSMTMTQQDHINLNGLPERWTDILPFLPGPQQRDPGEQNLKDPEFPAP